MSSSKVSCLCEQVVSNHSSDKAEYSRHCENSKAVIIALAVVIEHSFSIRTLHELCLMLYPIFLIQIHICLFLLYSLIFFLFFQFALCFLCCFSYYFTSLFCCNHSTCLCFFRCLCNCRLLSQELPVLPLRKWH